MSLKFYRTPRAERPWRPPIMDEDCLRYSRRARRARKWIPPRLAFEEVIRNNTASPCSLNDFVDYLVYIEQCAEPLQFFLWYCSYVHSWTALSPEQRALAPRWDPIGGRKLSHTERVTENASKVSYILDMLDEESEYVNSNAARKYRPGKTSFSHPRARFQNEDDGDEDDEEEEDDHDEEKGEYSSDDDDDDENDRISEAVLIASQPFRDDVVAITNHYIRPNAPRWLNLTKDDRNAVLAATASTTHPSALLPAFEKAEALLRGKLHPNFIRHCMANTNRAATMTFRILGFVLILLGLGLDVALILSTFSRYYRLLSTPLIFTGLTILTAALDGVSLPLHLIRARHLRPWEVPDLESGTGADKRHRRAANPETVLGAVDPLRKPTLQTLGPENVFAGQDWVAAYERRGIWRLVFERSILAGNEHLRILQDGVVVSAVLWAALLTVGLGVGSIFIPARNFF